MVEAYFNLAVAHHSNKNYEKAVYYFDKSIELNPSYSFAYLSKGNSLNALGKKHESVVCYQQSIDLAPNSEEAFYNVGIALTSLKQYEEASRNLIKAIELRDSFHEAYLALGYVQMNQRKFELAIESFDKAISINSELPGAYLNKGNALSELRKVVECLESYDRAIELQPNFPQAYCNRGYVLLNHLNQPALALVFFEVALELQPNLTEALVNKGQALYLLNELEKSKEFFLKALKLSPDSPYLIGKCLHHMMMLCDWDHLSEGLEICETVLNNKVPASVPFEVLNFFDKPELHLLTVKLCIEHKFTLNQALGDLKKNFENHRKVRIGYYSADLYFHPVSVWLVEQLENHDKNKVELYAFCLKSVQDPMRVRLEAAFDHWIDVQSMSDLEVAKISRELEIDIAIDLNGHTADGRTGIFAARAAPIQLNHIGFPGSMGAEYFDYIICNKPNPDEDLEELARNRQFITERIAYVPNNFTYDRQRQLSYEPLTRAQFGLPEKGFVFTCQNGCQKLTPEVFNIWMEILNAVPGSVLWLLKPNEAAVKNLIKEAIARGVEAQRLIFMAREIVPIDQEWARIGKYLASYKLADLFLDTWPYNAGTTAADALWAGLPVLTKEGKAMVARMAAGVLRGIEVPELITRTPEEYKDLAIELANNSEKLKHVKEKVQANRLRTALFDPVSNTRHIENAYLEMYRRYQSDLKPEDFFVRS
jgi:predicted O-linked N-acetylglucosamine transferase (SPINDLY family)